MNEFLMSLDWTRIIISVLGVVVAVCAGLLTRYILPWLKEKNLTAAAEIAVNAAEAVIGRYNGAEKLQYALDVMKQKGYNVNSEKVINAIKAAWKELDLFMFASGVKYVETEEVS